MSKVCWCGKEHPGLKHWVANWKLYFIRMDDKERKLKELQKLKPGAKDELGHWSKKRKRDIQYNFD